MSRFAMCGLPTVCALLAFFSPAISAHAPPPGKPTPADTEAQKKLMEEQKKQAHEQLKAQEISTLKSAYILLSLANNNYGPHKGKAMNEIEAALNIMDSKSIEPLKAEAKALQKLNNAPASAYLRQLQGIDLHQAISDDKVANATAMLTGLADTLAAKNQQKVLDPVKKAIQELKDAPKHALVLKGKEADVLTSAYVLLASANHDYDGHRAKAMTALEVACKILEVDLLKNGPLDKKIKALRDANAEAQAKNEAKQNAPVHEAQAASDAQLRMADALIQLAAVSLSANKQKRVFDQVETAHKEIGLALSVR
jgi:hypothetical protein